MRSVALRRRHNRLRKKVVGTSERPRLMVKKTLGNTYALVIDDSKGVTLASASSLKISSGSKSEKAKKVGEAIAQNAKTKNISTVIFDRGGYKYHGRVAEVANAARENGLIF